jgi:hypothetical protein
MEIADKMGYYYHKNIQNWSDLYDKRTTAIWKHEDQTGGHYES